MNLFNSFDIPSLPMILVFFMICYAASSWIPSGVVSVSSNVATENPRAIVRWLGLIFQCPTVDHRYGGFHSHGGSPLSLAGWLINHGKSNL